MARPFLQNHWRQDAPLYQDRETGLPTALGPFTMRWVEEVELWHFDGPKGLWLPDPQTNTWIAYHCLVDAYKGWWQTEPWQKVYFIGTAVELGAKVKIGTSMNPHQRLRQLQTAHPEPLKLLAQVRGDELLESQYHAKFRLQQRIGEWFTLNKAMIAEIELLHQSNSIGS